MRAGRRTVRAMSPDRTATGRSRTTSAASRARSGDAWPASRDAWHAHHECDPHRDRRMDRARPRAAGLVPVAGTAALRQRLARRRPDASTAAPAARRVAQRRAQDAAVGQRPRLVLLLPRRGGRLDRPERARAGAAGGGGMRAPDRRVRCLRPRAARLTPAFALSDLRRLATALLVIALHRAGQALGKEL